MMFEDESVSMTPQQPPAKSIYKPILKKATVTKDEEEEKQQPSTGKDSRLSTAKSTAPSTLSMTPSVSR
jgi:hypothetical protein